jgi:hypothetical protein
MASNSELFGTDMMKFREEQFYKKIFKVIEIPQLGRFDTSLMEDVKFYARFLAMYPAKMKKDWVKEDKNFK